MLQNDPGTKAVHAWASRDGGLVLCSLDIFLHCCLWLMFSAYCICVNKYYLRNPGLTFPQTGITPLNHQELYGVGHKKTQQSRRKLETFLRQHSCKVVDVLAFWSKCVQNLMSHSWSLFFWNRNIRESYPEEEAEAQAAQLRFFLLTLLVCLVGLEISN